MPRTRAQRIAKIALRVLGGLLALVAIVAGGTMLVLRTDWGGERLRRQIVSRVNQQIRGSLAIERLSFGGDRIQIWGVALHDPEGGVVASVARVEVGFAPLRVLRKELRLTGVAIETPILNVVSDQDGSNLARATAPRKKEPPRPTEPKKPVDRNGPEGWVIRLDRFDLTNGDIHTAVAAPDDDQGSSPTVRVHLADLGVFASARVATGNGSMDLSVRVSGRSEHAPVGPLRLAVQLAGHRDIYRFDADGDLLNGTLKAHGTVDAQSLENADALVALAIPQQQLAGHAWGPVRIDARTQPARPPKLDLLIKVPGIELAAKDSEKTAPGVLGHLAVSDLSVTRKAVDALGLADLPPMAGHGEVTFALDQASGDKSTGFEGQTRGSFDGLRFGETVISALKVDGRASRLSGQPGNASLDLSMASVTSGTTDVHGIALAAKLEDDDVGATLAVAAPARVDLRMDGRLSEDRHVLDLTRFALGLPGERWTSEGVARIRSDDKEVSISNLRLTSEGQALVVDGRRRGEDLSAHLALTDLRLAQLPTALIDPGLRLDGVLNVDVKVAGQTAAPKVAASLDLKQAAYQTFSKIDAKLNATLEDDQVDATMEIAAPFLAADAAVKLPVDPLQPGAPIDVKVDVKHLDIGQVMRAAKPPALADGRVNLKLRAEGSLDRPDLTVTLEAFGLKVKEPPAEAVSRARDRGHAQPPPVADSVDVGKARVRLTYADRVARAEVNFTSAHGGTLVVDGTTRVDLSYPRIKRPIVAKKLPIHGKVVARNLDVAWVAQLNPSIESMKGQVTADARLGGTVGDPQVIGDVRWKNGALVATTPPPEADKNPRGARPKAKARRSGASAR